MPWGIAGCGERADPTRGHGDGAVDPGRQAETEVMP
jgi:hypothetical protein